MKKAIMTGNNLREKDNDIGLQQKALDCDKNYTQITNAVPGHFERMYTIQYRYLSPYTHLDIEGINMFINETGDGQYSFWDGDNGILYLTTGIDICTALIKDLYDNKVIDGDLPDVVSEIENLIKSIEIKEVSQ